jgi:hypothetical protein
MRLCLWGGVRWVDVGRGRIGFVGSDWFWGGLMWVVV